MHSIYPSQKNRWCHQLHWDWIQCLQTEGTTSTLLPKTLTCKSQGLAATVLPAVSLAQRPVQAQCSSSLQEGNAHWCRRLWRIWKMLALTHTQRMQINAAIFRLWKHRAIENTSEDAGKWTFSHLPGWMQTRVMPAWGHWGTLAASSRITNAYTLFGPGIPLVLIYPTCTCSHHKPCFSKVIHGHIACNRRWFKNMNTCQKGMILKCEHILEEDCWMNYEQHTPWSTM